MSHGSRVTLRWGSLGTLNDGRTISYDVADVLRVERRCEACDGEGGYDEQTTNEGEVWCRCVKCEGRGWVVEDTG